MTCWDVDEIIFKRDKFLLEMEIQVYKEVVTKFNGLYYNYDNDFTILTHGNLLRRVNLKFHHNLFLENV